MENNAIFKQLLSINRTSLNTIYRMIDMGQNQVECMSETLTIWMPQGGSVVGEWFETTRKQQDNLKKMIDDSFKKTEEMLLT